MKLHAVPTAAGLRVLLEASSAEVLHAFRPRARFEGSEIDISEQKRSFRVRLLLRYQVFFKPMVRTAEISFQILPDGTLGDCSFRDPVPRASTVLCPQRVKEGVFQALSR